jgi:hypothetical protein
LDLLECQTERATELFVAHVQHESTYAHSVAEMLVDRIRQLFHAVPRASNPIIIFLYPRQANFVALRDLRPLMQSELCLFQ